MHGFLDDVTHCLGQPVSGVARGVVSKLVACDIPTSQLLNLVEVDRNGSRRQFIVAAPRSATCNDRFMQNSDTNGPEAVLDALLSLGILTILMLLVIWGLCGWIAWIVAPEDRRWTFFWLTFLLFGPLGILAAAVASPRDPGYFVGAVAAKRPRAEGRERYWCSRCGAQSDLFTLKNSSCWRCGEKRLIAGEVT